MDAPSKAVTHIQNTAPAPPADTAATTPTRFPMPTRVAVETMRVWNDERLSLLWFFSQTAEIISRNSRTGSRRVRIDTIVICSCTAFVMLLAPESVTAGLTGMDLLQAAVQYHLGSFGVIFIAVTLALFSFSTFIGILFYARSNVAYLFGDRWLWQTLYKVLALGMLLVGGVQAYTVVWDLGDVGIGLMTIFNLIALYPLSGEAIEALRDYERRKHLEH